MSCTKQSSKKYASRKSPPFPANKCCNKTIQGNDHKMYKSVANKNGVCSWKLAASGSSKTSKKTVSKKTASKKTQSKRVSKSASKTSKKSVSKRVKSSKRLPSKLSKMQKFSVLAYFKHKLPAISSTSSVKIVRKQSGTDNDGKTYYVDAVLSAPNANVVRQYFKNKTNFMSLPELNHA